MTDVIAGVFAGIAQTTVGFPLDTIKVRLQNQKSWKLKNPLMYYRGAAYPLTSSILFNGFVFSAFERSLPYTNSNVLSGLMSGFVISPMLFCFDVGKIKRQTNQKFLFEHIFQTKGLPITFLRESCAMSIYFGSYFSLRETMHPLFAGGIAGLLNWTLTYPLDIVRSRQIAQNISIQKAISQGEMWKGYLPCAIRAILVNGACFYVYEGVRGKLTSQD